MLEDLDLSDFNQSGRLSNGNDHVRFEIAFDNLILERELHRRRYSLPT
jgi:hypothetical protein